MTDEERKHFEELKKRVPDEIVTIVSMNKVKIVDSYFTEILYSNGTKELILRLDCCAMGTGCRSGIPFNPNNFKSFDFTWERDKYNEQGGDYDN